jgi:hypothetical protein
VLILFKGTEFELVLAHGDYIPESLFLSENWANKKIVN